MNTRSSFSLSMIPGILVALVLSLAFVSSDAVADTRANKKKARALIKVHKETLRALKRLRISPAGFATVAGAASLTDSDGDGVPDLYEEAKPIFNSCDIDSDDDGTEDDDENSSSSGSSSSSDSEEDEEDKPLKKK